MSLGVLALNDAFQTKVAFYVEAQDGLGTVTRFPGDAPERTCLFSGRSASERLQLLSDVKNTETLASRPLHSNHLIDTTVVYGEEEVFYNAGLRYRGSPWGRPQRQSYRIRFPKDKRYLGGLTAINLSNRDRGDGPALFMIRRMGTPTHPTPGADYRYITAVLNGRSLGRPGIFDPVDRRFVEKWYGAEAADHAVVLKGNGRLRFSDRCERVGWDEATLHHMDEYSENYRFYWSHSVHQTRDNWEPFMSLTKLIHKSRPEEMDDTVAERIDLDVFLAVLGARIMMADGDALLIGNGHNGYMAWDPTDGRWEYLPFDMGGVFGGAQPNLYAVRDAGLRRLLGRPIVKRAYLRVLQQAIHEYWDPRRSGRYLRALESVAHSGLNLPPAVATASRLVKRELSRSDAASLAIRTNDGRDFEASGPTVQLIGVAPVAITDLFFQRGDGDLERFAPRFKSPTQWVTELTVEAGLNRFSFFGADADGSLVGPVTISIAVGTRFRRGDVDASGAITVTDVFSILLALFKNRPQPCRDAADVNDDGAIELDDAIALARFLFQSGPPPAPPFAKRGTDPTADDDLDCVRG